MNSTSFFVKIGSKENMKRLMDGQVYCNTSHFFANMEDDSGRNDMNEIRFEYLNLPNVDDQNGHIQLTKQYKNDIPCGNLYCLYNYNIDIMEVNKKYPLKLDTKLGPYCVVIHEAQIFINRVLKELGNRNLKNNCGYVRYKDLNTHQGFKSPFIKDIEFQKQNEYRFFIAHDKVERIILKIGSIKDIAQMISVEEFESQSIVNFDLNLLVQNKKFS